MLDQDLSTVSVKSGIKVVNAATPAYEAFEDDHERKSRIPDMDDFDPETYDAYIFAQVQLPRHDDEYKLGKVIQRVRGGFENQIGKHNKIHSWTLGSTKSSSPMDRYWSMPQMLLRETSTHE
jgi:hypothetical protein